MNLYLGCDHAAFEVKQKLIAKLSPSYQIIDSGCNSQDRANYAQYAIEVAKAIQKNTGDRGILICGSGIGMSIVANKFRGIRASLCLNETMAKLTRNHNDSNILCLSARLCSLEEIEAIVSTWLSQEYEGGRHNERLKSFESLGEVKE